MSRTPLVVLLLLSTLAWVCSLGCPSSGGNNDPVDVVVAFDWNFPDEVTSAEPDVPAEDIEVFVPQCYEDDDCVGQFDRPLAKCEMPACEDNLCEIQLRPNGTACDDNEPCTQGDECQDGVCISGFNTCACETDEDCVEQDDGNPCNGTLMCDTDEVPYVCVADPATIPICDDGEDTTCLQNQCDPDDGICKMQPANEGVACDDGDPCTSATRCDAEGQCVGNDACQCREDEDCESREDGNLCNGTLICDMSSIPFTCQVNPTTLINCPALPTDGPCSRNTCQPETGYCLKIDVADGTVCEDGTACTVGDQCLGGVCVSGEDTDCDDGNPCTNDGCDAFTGNCTHVANMSSCEEVHECFVGDYCEEGVCKQGTPLSCNDGDVCTVDTCVQNDDPYDDPCVHTYSEELCPPPE